MFLRIGLGDRVHVGVTGRDGDRLERVREERERERCPGDRVDDAQEADSRHEVEGDEECHGVSDRLVASKHRSLVTGV